MSKSWFSLEADFVNYLLDLPKFVHSKLVRCLNLLSRDQRHPGLNVESLRGRAEGLLSARVDLSYRLIFFEPSENQICLLFIGKEEEAYRYAERARPQPQRPIQLTKPPIAMTELSAVIGLISVKTKKYLPLSRFLAEQPASMNQITLSFTEVEKIIGETLPDSACKHPAWWANDLKYHVQASAWLAVGWKTKNLHRKERQLTFVRAL